MPIHEGALDRGAIAALVGLAPTDRISGAPTGMAGMTHFQALRDAFPEPSEDFPGQCEKQLCSGCGREFWPSRAWQRQCSPRCRQRAYVARQDAGAILYYGA